VKIEHVALWTRDLEKMKNFYEEVFGGKASEKYSNPKTHFESYFIKFTSGARLELMKKTSIICFQNDKGLECIGYAHIAFSVGSKEKVDSITEEIREKGFSVVSEARTTGDGYYESCVLDPEDNRVEITA
jgi:lactoylglutathione lyase